MAMDDTHQFDWLWTLENGTKVGGMDGSNDTIKI